MSPRRHEVRLIGGLWKRSKLPVAEIEGLRPTPDRVRETLFNWLGQDLDGWRCLDAFAGAGALGLEAASRGAAQVVLIERERRLAASLSATCQRLHASQVRVECTDAMAWMARSPAEVFELVFLDPPYDAELLDPALVLARRLVVPQGFVYIESGQPLDATACTAPGWRVHRQARAGAVHYGLLQRE